MSSVTRPTNVRHLVLAALLVITAINYVQRNCIGPSATTIERSIGVTPKALDLAAGAFFLTYTLFQIPSGMLAKRWGPRVVLPLYAAGWSVALGACAAATGYVGLTVGRGLMGVFQAGIFPCATLVLSVWYPPSWRGTATALLNSFMLLGGALGGAAAGWLLNEGLSWQTLFLLYAAPGLVWAAWFAWWFRDRPEDHPGVNEAERALLDLSGTSPPPPLRSGEGEPERASIAVPLRGLRSAPRAAREAAQRPVDDDAPSDSPSPLRRGGRGGEVVFIALTLPVLLLATQQFFRAAAPRLFDYRLPTYYEKERGLTLTDATALAAWPQYAGVVGGLLGGMLSDYLLRRTGSRYLARNGVAAGSLAVCIAWYVAAWYAEDVYVAAGLLAAGSFFFNFSSPCAYALAIDIGGKHLPVVFGLMNMAGNFGAYAFVTWLMTLVEAGGWPLAFGVWGAMHVIALVCWLVLDPSRTIGETS